MDANQDHTLLNCTEEAFIKVLNVRVDDEGYCESEPCTINDRDHEALRKLCDNSNHCLIYRSNISSSCSLDQQRRFNMSYMCEGKTFLYKLVENMNGGKCKLY